MHDTMQVTPALIRRYQALPDGRIEMVSVPAQRGAGRALLLFMDEEQAETFRAETGTYPAEEGFIVEATSLEGLRAIVDAWSFERIAMRGPEPDAVSEFDAQMFIGMLAESKEA